MSGDAQPAGAGWLDWLGRSELRHDLVSPVAVRALEATLGSGIVQAAPGDAAPLLSHWLHFLDAVPLAEVGADGHPRRGGFLPPVTLPRRMWAGSRIDFKRPLRIGAAVTRRSTISNLSEKEGKSGRLLFVTVEHEISDDTGVVLDEVQDIVYREAQRPGAAPAPDARAPENPQWRWRIDPDPVLLFRYSALTFNGHRIHYDRPYATQVEGYPGLVVHGPLIATLLLHSLRSRHPGATVKSFAFRAVKPIIDGAPFDVCGTLADDGSATLFAADHAGALCMDAAATLG